MKTSRASGYPLFWRSMGKFLFTDLPMHDVDHSYVIYVFVLDVSRPLSFVGEELVKLALEIPRRFRWVGFLLSLEALRHSCIWGKLFIPIA